MKIWQPSYCTWGFQLVFLQAIPDLVIEKSNKLAYWLIDITKKSLVRGIMQ